MADPIKLPLFEGSKIFLLEILGEGAFGKVQKTYDKEQSEFIALKTIKKNDESNEASIKLFNDTMMEDTMLQKIEEIRKQNQSNDQYFLKY